MERTKDIDPVIRVRRACNWQVDWLAGLLNISKKDVAELVVDEYIESRHLELEERTLQMLRIPIAED